MSSRKGWHLIFSMEDKICSFFGHRDIDITDRLYTLTAAEITRAVDMGFRSFYFGGYGSFDDLCHKILTKIKTTIPTLPSSEYTVFLKNGICVKEYVTLTPRTMTKSYTLPLLLPGGIKAFILETVQ